MKKQILAAAIGACLAMPVIAHAADDTVATGGKLAPTDMAFVNAAAQGGMDEIETSKVAKSKSDNKDVIAFAKHMIDDHKKANSQLKSIAKKLDVKLPGDLDATHKADVQQLKTADKSDFDQKYIAIQDLGHNATVAAFQKEADTGENAMLKQFAQKTLPTLQEHMKEVKALEAKMPPAATTGTMDTTK